MNGMGLELGFVMPFGIYMSSAYMGHTWAELVGTCTCAFGYILPTGTQVWVLCSRTRTRSTRWVEVFAH
jgi:hypothetical protein